MWAFSDPEPFRTDHGASTSMRGPEILILPKEAP